MAPRRPLVDLSLIAVFKQLTPNDQLKAAAMSPRCKALVRAANRRVKTLIITKLYRDGKKTKASINYFSVNTKPSMILVKDSHQGVSPNYPMGDRLSKRSCLQLNLIAQIDSTTIEQIFNVFPALTDLKFIYFDNKQGLCKRNFNHQFEHLLALLEHPYCTKQLTSFMLFDDHRISDEQANRLFTAINGLTALQHLALYWSSFVNIPDMPILGQLKTVQLNLHSVLYKSAELFFRSLETNVTTNVDLKVDFSCSKGGAYYLPTFSNLLCNRIVRFFADYAHIVPFEYHPFPSLTSLTVTNLRTSHVGPLWAALSQLKQLIHLELKVDFEKRTENHPIPEHSLPPRPLAQLNALRALDLTLIRTSHSQVSWLNLQWTAPNLQAIHLSELFCRSCYKTQQRTKISHNFECMRSLFDNLHLGVSKKRIIYSGTTAERLLLALS